MKKHLPALCLLSLSLSPAVLMAEEVPHLVIHPDKRSLTSPSVKEAETLAELTPGGVDVVPAERFENTRAVNIKDMLDFTPGVVAQPRYGEEARLSIRGSGLSRTFHLRGIRLLQDGIPINMADGGGDFQELDPLAYRYVEVFKGANALEYGAATLGGAINFVTPTGHDADRFGLRVEGGSYNMRRMQVSSGGSDENTDYYISASHLGNDGFRDFSQQRNQRVFGNIGYNIAPHAETRFYITYADINQELPGNLTRTQLANDPKQANPTNKAMNQQRDYTLTRFANKTSVRMSDALTLDMGAYVTVKDLYHPIFEIVDQQNEMLGIFSNATWDGTIGTYRNRFTGGIHANTGTTDSKRYRNLAGNYGALTSDAQEEASNIELHGENRWYVRDDTALILGAQATFAEREYQDHFLSNGNQSGSRDYNGFSPKAGVLWDATPDIQLFSNLSRAYEPPTLSELTQSLPGVTGIANIKAQTATTAEIGSRGQAGNLSWDISLYRAWVEDELMMFSVNAAGASGVLNADQTIHQGLEMGLAYRILPPVALTLAYSLNDFHFDGDPQWGDKQLPGAPEHYLRAEVRYRHASGFSIAPQVEWVPVGYPVDMANTVYTDDYATFGIQAEMAVTEHLKFFIDGRNLTDENYAATTGVVTNFTPANQAQFIPGDGRAVYAGMKVTW